MKHLFILAGLMLGIAAAACAQQPEPVHSSHTVAEKLSPIYADGRCRFQFKTVPGQRYSDKDYIFDPTKDDPSGWAFGIGCHTGASQEDIDILLGAKRIGDKWNWVDANAPFSPAQHLKVTQIVGKNWNGTVVGYDMITGPEALRQRILTYCIFETNGPQILCGRGPAMGTSSPATTNLIDKVLAVLETLVFVDQPANPPTASSTAAGH
jgi:hypothetical protein